MIVDQPISAGFTWLGGSLIAESVVCVWGKVKCVTGAEWKGTADERIW